MTNSFKPSVNPGVSLNVLGSSSSTTAYGPLSDEKYTDKDYWQTQNYDFSGTIKRQSSYNENHANKWVMDYEKGIPVHGNSVAATLEFPGAGKVTISKTNLVNMDVSTEDSYKFAVQGVKPDEKTISVKAEEKEKYRFVSWYKIPNVITDQLEKNHNYYDAIRNRYTPISNEKELTNVQIDNNDLLIAFYQTQVLFYDVNGNIIDKTTGDTVSGPSDDDWYNYGSEIPNVIPSNKPTGAIGASSKLIGWTTIKSDEPSGAYSSIASPQLTNLKNNNAFYKVGDKITKPMDLYPVYMDLLYNIHTVFEGNEQDSIDDISKRDGVGYTSIKMSDMGDPVISVVGINEDKTFPTGYNFLGWYDESNVRVSSERDFTLKDIDLTSSHTYTAKFEYLVEYYIRAFAQNEGNAFTESELFGVRWQKYNTSFDNIPAPGYIREHITHWGIEHINHHDTDDKSDAYDKNITSPLKVYSHNYETATGNVTPYQALITTDFPGSGSITDEHHTAGGKFRFTPESNRYHLQFWTLERQREGWTYIKNPMDTGILDTTILYKGMAMVTTDIVFHKKNDEEVSVTRRYNNKLFVESDETHTYKYPFIHQDEDVSTNPEDGSHGDLNKTITIQASPSDTDMQVKGYAFLGWISSLDVTKNSTEWNYIYDVKNDLYCTSDSSKAKPYLLTKEEVIEQTQDVYPVYAKYNIITTTNINYGNISSKVNIPTNPEYLISESKTENGIATINITPDLDTYVIGNSGEKYALKSLVRVYEDGSEEEIQISNSTYNYTIEAGPTYTFMAKYEPLVLVYHLNNSDTDIVVKTSGQVVGTQPMPTYNLSKELVFIGWTTSKPTQNGYHELETYSELESSNISIIMNSTLVNQSIELWPVYISMQIKVNSNIDDYLTANNIGLETVRYITRPTASTSQLNALEENLGSYEFIGWYKNYRNEQDYGELITTNTTYILENKENLQSDIYTAVYKQVFNIYYHNTKGEIIHNVNVHQDEHRSFVNEVIDDQGNSITVPIDSEAYDKIYKTLESNEIFQNWQWQQSDGTLVNWDNFYNKNINQTMNLYPMIRKITAKDSFGNEIDVIGTQEQEPYIILGTDKEQVYVCFNTEYEQPNLTIHIENVSYKDNGSDIEFTEGIKVNVYSNTNIEEKILGTANTDVNGDATINFYGEIVITKNAGNEDSIKDLFIYEILDKDNNVINEVLISQGESKTVIVPYGNYTIRPRLNWAWRYNKDLNKNIKVNNKNIITNIVFDDTRNNNKWFDSMTHIDNLYN